MKVRFAALNSLEFTPENSAEEMLLHNMATTAHSGGEVRFEEWQIADPNKVQPAPDNKRVFHLGIYAEQKDRHGAEEQIRLKDIPPI